MLMEGLLELEHEHKPGEPANVANTEHERDDQWNDVDGENLGRTVSLSKHRLRDVARTDSLFNRRALQEYILYASQHHAGGLVDKPPKYALSV